MCVIHPLIPLYSVYNPPGFVDTSAKLCAGLLLRVTTKADKRRHADTEIRIALSTDAGFLQLLLPSRVLGKASSNPHTQTGNGEVGKKKAGRPRESTHTTQPIPISDKIKDKSFYQCAEAIDSTNRHTLTTTIVPTGIPTVSPIGIFSLQRTQAQWVHRELEPLGHMRTAAASMRAP